MRRAVMFLSLAALCGSAGRARAGDRSPLDLAALLDEAARGSPELVELKARAESAATVPLQREALPDPKLSVAYTNDGVTSFTLGDSEFTNLTLGWEQEVPQRSVRARAAAVAQAEAETAEASRSAAAARLRARVIAVYVELWRLDRLRTLLDERRTLLASGAAAAQARYESGEGIQEGLIRGQAEVRRLDLEIALLRSDRRQAEITLGAALGRTAASEFGPADVLPDVAEPIDEEAMAAAATAASPEVLESRSSERTAEARLADARAQTVPEFSWLAAYQYRGGLDPMVTGGFSIRLPVWKDRKQARAVAGAELTVAAAASERARFEILAGARARALAAEVGSIDERLALYRDALVPQAAAAFASANAAFASGRAELPLVLDDLDRWIEARRDELALRAQRIGRVASLEEITGRTLLAVPGNGRTP